MPQAVETFKVEENRDEFFNQLLANRQSQGSMGTILDSRASMMPPNPFGRPLPHDPNESFMRPTSRAMSQQRMTMSSRDVDYFNKQKRGLTGLMSPGGQF